MRILYKVIFPLIFFKSFITDLNAEEEEIFLNN